MRTLEGFVAGWLAENKVKRQSLAETAGVSLATLNARINGKSELTISFARRLAGILGVTVEEICRLAPETRGESDVS